MYDEEGLNELLKGVSDVSRVQNLVELYGKCERNPILESDRPISENGKKRLEFTEKVEKALIKALNL